jgi:hypothetical protein
MLHQCLAEVAHAPHIIKKLLSSPVHLVIAGEHGLESRHVLSQMTCGKVEALVRRRLVALLGGPVLGVPRLVSEGDVHEVLRSLPGQAVSVGLVGSHVANYVVNDLKSRSYTHLVKDRFIFLRSFISGWMQGMLPL